MTVVLNGRGPRVTRSVPDAESRRELRKAGLFCVDRLPVTCFRVPVLGAMPLLGPAVLDQEDRRVVAERAEPMTEGVRRVAATPQWGGACSGGFGLVHQERFRLIQRNGSAPTRTSRTAPADWERSPTSVPTSVSAARSGGESGGGARYAGPVDRREKPGPRTGPAQAGSRARRRQAVGPGAGGRPGWRRPGPARTTDVVHRARSTLCHPGDGPSRALQACSLGWVTEVIQSGGPPILSGRGNSPTRRPTSA